MVPSIFSVPSTKWNLEFHQFYFIYRNSSNEGLKLSSVGGQTLFSSFRNTFSSQEQRNWLFCKDNWSDVVTGSANRYYNKYKDTSAANMHVYIGALKEYLRIERVASIVNWRRRKT